METELKEKWIEALRSGRYAQTTELLHRVSPLGDCPVGYCCLGVLCDVITKLPDPPFNLEEDSSGCFLDDTYGSYYTELGVLKTRLGITKEQELTLIRMNDGFEGDVDTPPNGQRNFSEIADYIEKNI